MAGLAPVGVALLGAGSFARDAHLPVLAASGGALRLEAVWSRRQASAEALLPQSQGFAPSCRAYHGPEGMQAVLALPAVEAVVVALPPQSQPAVIQAALRSGKHVLSEKPAGPTLEAVEQLLAFAATLPAPVPLWCVAENYRAMDAFLRLRDALASGRLGALARLDLAVDLAMTPGNKYYDSQWRRDSSGMPGAYLTEGGVHFIAGLRMAARAAGWSEAVGAAAVTTGLKADLPSPDTLTGTLYFQTAVGRPPGDVGAGSAPPTFAATFGMTMAAGVMRVSLTAVGTEGMAEVVRGGLEGGVSFRLCSRTSTDVEATQEECEGGRADVLAELLSFARLVRGAAATQPAAAGSALTQGEAVQAALSDGSDPERPAVAPAAASAGGAAGVGIQAQAAGPAVEGGASGIAAPVSPPTAPQGHAALESLPSEEDAYRVSAVEAARDLACMTALLDSAAQGGTLVPVRQLA